ncbi:Ribonuclease BN, tRNA processing enzyme [Jatrophihabitans endophyticus]|uniref:Ribonuclease BN, tRNA processing enzyme n=1 Tax=Jatrophihabitans endophyticus TaxID=1206085 RepID=A0A1M5PJA4_9ACTN|nr:MBL fold metallo-hydrolase [Jatrophihabitans endophyticus]SHH01795.1 Ribonuclease BN, tRNA processing enzyme [Jatrophihabitans endophyticus]
MKLTVLGCSGSVPGPDSPASGYLVEAEGYRLLLDLGHGAFGALQRYVDPADVDAIVISHLHADHCIDLTAYVVALRYGGDGYALRGPERRIPLVGVPGTRDRLEAAYDPLARKLGLQGLFAFGKPVESELGPFRMSYARVNHPTPTNAVRISWNDRSLVYSADTGESADLVELAEGADVFLCEASVGPDEELVPDLHLTGRMAGEHADKAGVGRLVITHVPPWNSPQVAADDAAEAFSGSVELARPGAEFQV